MAEPTEPKIPGRLCDYVSVTADTPGALAEACTKMLGDYYIPAGGPVLMPGPVAGQLKLVQAMYRVIPLTESQVAEMKRAESEKVRAGLKIV